MLELKAKACPQRGQNSLETTLAANLRIEFCRRGVWLGCMASRRVLLFVLLGIAVLPAGGRAAEPRNLDRAKQEIVRYVDSGDYERDLARVAARAEKYLTARLATPPKPGQKFAVVFDLDETLLSNLPHMRPLGFGYVPPLWQDWVAEGNAPAIAPLVRIYHAAQAGGAVIFLISDRREKDRAGTEKNLLRAGLGGYAALHLKPDDSSDNARSFKTDMRRKITADGYTIVANLGDQESDLAGGHAEKTFKLPNPFYLTE